MQKSVEISSDIKIVPNSERRFNYAFNVPNERITFVKEGKVQRKNEANMSDTEKRTFIDGITAFNNLPVSPYYNGNYRQTVTIHEKPHRMHSMDGSVGTQRFLVWHRVYLTRLESSDTLCGLPKFFYPILGLDKKPKYSKLVEELYTYCVGS